jgi:hypothetical protein
MSQVIKFRTPYLSPIEIFERQVKSCPNKAALIRGAVSTLKDTEKVFLLFESKNPLKPSESMTNQIVTDFQGAEKLFFYMLTLMGNAGWQCSPGDTKYFIEKLNKIMDTIGENDGVMLPQIKFTKVN